MKRARLAFIPQRQPPDPDRDMEYSLGDVAVFALTFLLAGMVKGVTGMGLPTVAMAVLGALFSPLVAAALLIVPSLVTNVWQLMAGPGLARLCRRLWPMMLMIALATMLGSSLMARGDTSLTTVALGGALVAYAGFTLAGRQLHVPPSREGWMSPLIGLATGVVTGATGVLVIPAAPYLQALDLEKDELVQALGLPFTVSTVALAAGLAWHGALPARDVTASALMVVPALAGMVAGQAIRRQVSPGTFRRWFLISLLILGLEMVARPLI